MCTAVVGGSIHRVATRISAASDQRSTTPMTSHRIKDRRKSVRSGVLVSVFGIAITFQTNSLGCRMLPVSRFSRACPERQPKGGRQCRGHDQAGAPRLALFETWDAADPYSCNLTPALFNASHP